VSVSKQILIQFISQKKISSTDVSEIQKFCLQAPLKLCLITHFWYVLMLNMSLLWTIWSSGIWRWLVVSVWLSNVLKERGNFEILGCTHPKTECHITEYLNIQLQGGDTLQCHISLPCYKGPHNMIITFGVWCLWRNGNREWENMFVNWKWLSLVGSYCSLVIDKKFGRWLLTNCR